MAYEIKYWSRWQDTTGGWWEIRLLEKDFEGEPTYQVAAGNPIRLQAGNPDGQSWAQLRAMMLDWFPEIDETIPTRFEEIFGADPDQFRMEAYYNGEPVFAGPVKTDLYEEPDNVYPIYPNIRATDGLELLRQVPYPNAGQGRVTRAIILTRCLNQTGTEIGVAIADSLFAGSMDSASNDDNPWGQALIDQARYIDERGEPWNCWDVLHDIIPPGYSVVMDVGPVGEVELSPDGTFLWAYLDGSMMRHFISDVNDPTAPVEIKQLNYASSNNPFSVYHLGDKIATRFGTGSIRVYNNDLSLLWISSTGHSNGLKGICFDNDGNTYSCDTTFSVKKHRAADGVELWTKTIGQFISLYDALWFIHYVHQTNELLVGRAFDLAVLNPATGDIKRTINSDGIIPINLSINNKGYILFCTRSTTGSRRVHFNTQAPNYFRTFAVINPGEAEAQAVLLTDGDLSDPASIGRLFAFSHAGGTAAVVMRELNPATGAVLFTHTLSEVNQAVNLKSVQFISKINAITINGRFYSLDGVYLGAVPNAAVSADPHFGRISLFTEYTNHQIHESAQSIKSPAATSVYAAIPADAAIWGNNDRTFMGWFKSAHGDFSALFVNTSSASNNTRFSIHKDASTNLIRYSFSGTFTNYAGAATPNNEWFHFAVTYNHAATEVKFYLNGVLEDTVSVSLASLTSSELRILRNFGTFYAENGSADEIKIFTETLTLEQINAVKDDTSYDPLGRDFGLKYYFPFEQNAGPRRNIVSGLDNGINIVDITFEADTFKNPAV